MVLRRMSPKHEVERGSTAKVAAMTGYSVRQVHGMAILGKIPSAAKLNGTRWSFDLKRVRQWIQEKEREVEALAKVPILGVRLSPRRAVGNPQADDADLNRRYEEALGIRKKL